MSPAGGARAAPSLLFSLLLAASAPLWLRAEKMGERGRSGRAAWGSPCDRGSELELLRGCAEPTWLIPDGFIRVSE